MPRCFPPLALLCALLLLAPGCGPEKPAADAWQNAGFVNYVAADAEGFLSLRQPSARWREIFPALAGVLADPSLRESWLGTPWGRIVAAVADSPQSAPLGAALADAGEDEVFVVLGRGTAARLAAVQQVKRLFGAARLRNLFTPPPPAEVPPEPPEEDVVADGDLAAAAFTEVDMPLPPAMEAALQKFVTEASVPPLIFGAKLRDGGGALPAFFKAWAEGLPEKCPREKFALGPHGEFVRVRVPVAHLVPRASALRARDILAAQIGDPYAATRIVRALLSKTAVISFGAARGYFLVATAPDDAPPALAENFGLSLAASPAMARVAPLLGPEVAALFYADPLIVALAASPPPVDEYLEAALESAAEFGPAERGAPLRESAATLRRQAAELFGPRVAAATGVVRREGSAWRAEIFGGSLAPRLAAANGAPLLDAPPGLALLWTERWADGYTGRLLQFAGGMSAFSADWMAGMGPLFLDPAHIPWAGRLLGALQPPAARLAGIAPESWDRAFDANRALAVGLDGVMPPPPMLPAAARKALLPRVAVAAGLRDRAALDNNWQAIAAPPGGDARAWPAPVSTPLPGGGVCHEYPVPLGGPDLAPAAVIENGRWLLGTSGSFAQALAAAPATSGSGGSIQAIRAETAPLASFAAAWADALAAEPSLASLTWGLLPANPGALRAAADLLREPRRFRYEARWEGKIVRRTLWLEPAATAPPAP